MSYRLCTLYSGSTGNAAYLETPTARILIDAGKCTRTLLSSLKSIGVDVDTLDAIFVTHEHTDHCLQHIADKCQSCRSYTVITHHVGHSGISATFCSDIFLIKKL